MDKLFKKFQNADCTKIAMSTESKRTKILDFSPNQAYAGREVGFRIKLGRPRIRTAEARCNPPGLKSDDNPYPRIFLEIHSFESENLKLCLKGHPDISGLFKYDCSTESY